MVHETVDIAAHILDFNSGNTSAQLQRSSSSFVLAQQQQQQQQQPHTQPDQQEDLLTASLNSRLLPNSAENLNWTFLEQVSSLDNQLRNEEPSGAPADDCDHHLMATKSMHDVNATGTVDGQHQETITRKPNGYAHQVHISNDGNLSQQSPDLILQQQQHLQRTDTEATIPTTTSFKFTSPTTTFKRKKQQQLQQLQQQQQQQTVCINNNNNTNQNQQTHAASGHKQQKSVAVLAQKSRGNHCSNALSNQQPNNQSNASAAAMIRNNAVLDLESPTATLGRTTEAGNGNTGATKTRTLPTISIRGGAYAKELDLVGDTKATETSASAAGKCLQRPATKMGATLTGGSAAHSFVDGLEMHLGLMGWRKKCLYTLLALLMLLIITNLALTLWILKVMEFSTEGMGQLKIVPGGVQLSGQALIMDMLRASTIRSRHGQPIAIESSRNFSINTRDTNGMLENHLFLGHDKLECLSTGFRINDTAGRNLFSVNRNEVTIGAHALRIDGEGGAIFRESIQTPHVRAEPGRELRLESPTRQLEMSAAKDINLQSRAGGIELSALEDVKLSALDGSLRLESSKILMPNLRTAQPPIPGSAQSHDHLHRVFQLCACSNGKLFLAAPHSICAGDDSTVCR